MNIKEESQFEKEINYKIIFDTGKPYEKIVKEKDLYKELLRFYEENKDNNGFYDIKILDMNDIDFTESQFIQEIIGDIIY
jgi:hypothetical protein